MHEPLLISVYNISHVVYLQLASYIKTHDIESQGQEEATVCDE